MFFDTLLIAIIQTTPFTYREDCDELFSHNAPAYHRVVEHWKDETPHITEYKTSHVNLCLEKNGGDVDHVVHEIGHELHHRIREDQEYEKFVNAWTLLHEMSSTDADYVSDYAKTNEKEDFADTFEEYYKWNKVIPTVEPGDWIDSGVSEIQYTKFLLMKMIIDKYSISLNL